MRLVHAVGVLMFLSVLFAAADVSGVWNGTMAVANSDGETTSFSVHCVLKADGSQLSGTCGPLESEQKPIQNGTIEGARIVFDVQTSKPMHFACTLEAQEMRGDVKKEGLGPATASLARVRK